jgi:hypothetical protein
VHVKVIESRGSSFSGRGWEGVVVSGDDDDDEEEEEGEGVGSVRAGNVV